MSQPGAIYIYPFWVGHLGRFFFVLTCIFAVKTLQRSLLLKINLGTKESPIVYFRSRTEITGILTQILIIYG